MALASAGKVPDRGRKFVIFGFFSMVFCLDLGRDPTKITAGEPWLLHQLSAVFAPANTGRRQWFTPAGEPRAVDHRLFNVGHETRSKHQ